jgi:HEAT repeat protein
MLFLCIFIAQCSHKEEKKDKVDVLIYKLSVANPKIKQEAIKELGKTNDPRAVGLLIAALKDKDEAEMRERKRRGAGVD